MKKVILTGFKPLFGRPSPTEYILCCFKSCIIIPQTEIVILILPNTYLGAFKILSDAIDKEKPDAIVSLGLYENAEEIEIETFFRNFMKDELPDASGYFPDGIKINSEQNAQEFLAPQVNTYFFANKLCQENIPVKPSANKYTSVSNSLGYRTTKKILDDHLPIRNMFIYIPWIDNYKNQVDGSSKLFLKKDDVIKAIKLMVLNIC